MREQLPEVPKMRRYIQALTTIETRITSTQRELLVAHWSAPNHVITATELSHAIGAKDFRAVNANYGRLGVALRQELGYDVPGTKSYVISWFKRSDKPGTHWELHMHRPLADALEQLGWVGTRNRTGVTPSSTQPRANTRKGSRCKMRKCEIASYSGPERVVMCVLVLDDGHVTSEPGANHAYVNDLLSCDHLGDDGKKVSLADNPEAWFNSLPDFFANSSFTKAEMVGRWPTSRNSK